MVFFDYNRDYINGRYFLYYEFPAYYVYNKKEKTWTPRKKDRIVNRIYYINPGAGERFFLYILLITVSGPISYKYLYIVNGVLYGTFKKIYLTRKLIINN